MSSPSSLQARISELETQLAQTKLKKCPNLPALLRADKTAYGTLIQSPSPFWITWGGPFIAETVDFVFIDTEHTPIQRQDLCALCTMYQGVGLPALVRVVDAEEARQALDGGAAGVVCPYMETVEQVKALRGAVKLRPFKGKRLEKALDENKIEGEEISEYIKKKGDEKALVLNIESQAAIDNLEAMLAPELGVDAVLIGPHDLSCNLGVPEQYQHQTFQDAVKTIFSKARKAGVGASIHQIGPLFGPGMDYTTAGTMVRDWGCNNIVVGGDLALFISGLQQSVNHIKEVAGEETEGLATPVSGVVA